MTGNELSSMMKPVRNTIRSVAAWALGFGLNCVGIVAEPITLKSLLAEMVDPVAVARYPAPDYQCLPASSYNRSSIHLDQKDEGTTGGFADSDGIGFVRTEMRGARQEWVLMEHTGPG